MVLGFRSGFLKIVQKQDICQKQELEKLKVDWKNQSTFNLKNFIDEVIKSEIKEYKDKIFPAISDKWKRDSANIWSKFFKSSALESENVMAITTEYEKKESELKDIIIEITNGEIKYPIEWINSLETGILKKEILEMIDKEKTQIVDKIGKLRKNTSTKKKIQNV